MTRREWARWVGSTLVLAFVAWHAVFDISIDRAMKRYVEARERYVAGTGPEVTIRPAMAAARADGARMGLGAAAAVAACGGAATAWVAKRRRSA